MISRTIASATFVALVFACSSDPGSTTPDPDEPPAPVCIPFFDNGFSGLEGTLVEGTLACQSNNPPSDMEFAVDSLPSGATFDSQTNTISWTPGLDQAGAHPITITISSSNESATLDLNVTDALEHPANIPIGSPESYKEEFGLPVLWISDEPTDRDWQPIELYYRGTKIESEARLRGASSTTYDKKSYAFRFLDQKLNETQVADFRSRSRLVATSTFDDNSYLRQRLVFSLWNALNPTIKLQAYSGILYINGVFHGLYTFTDQPDIELMQRAGLPTSGNLFKAINHDANFRLANNNNEPKDTWHDGFEKTEGTPKEGEDGAFTDLDEFVEFVATSSDADFESQITEKITVDDYHKWFLLATYTLSEDSGGKNSYHYHNQTVAWSPLPWDFNHSFGQTWKTARRSSDTINHFNSRNDIFRRLGTHSLHGPERDALFKNELEQGAFHKDNVVAMLDKFAIETELAAGRDWGKWENAYRSFARWNNRTDFTTPQEELDYLRIWIEERWQTYQDLF